MDKTINISLFVLKEVVLSELTINVSYDGENEEIAVICPEGYIDTTTSPEIENVLLQVLARKKYRVIMDLENVDYVNSSGWGVFIREIKQMRQNGGDLILLNMTPDVFSVYETMEFSKILKSFNTIENALAYFTDVKT